MQLYARRARLYARRSRYMPEERSYMPEERGYMEAMNSVATTFAKQPVCNTARAAHALRLGQ